MVESNEALNTHLHGDADTPPQAVEVTPDWLNAETCIENMEIAYGDALEADLWDDDNPVPIDTVVDAGDLGVLIGLARHALARHRLASTPIDPSRQSAEIIDQIAAKLAASDGLIWEEVCPYEVENEDGCDSSTCVAAHYEDHDPEVARANYRKWARIAFDASLSSLQHEGADESVGQADQEAIAEIVYAAMTWAADQSCTDNHPSWVPRGNSYAQDKARDAARNIATLPPLPADGGVERLREGEWFYPEGDHSSDECRFSHDEVIDYALEGDAVSQVVAIERAASLPTVYAAVRVWSDAEKDERGSDNDYDYKLFATADEALAALSDRGVVE